MRFSSNIISIGLVICIGVYAKSETLCPKDVVFKPCGCEELMYNQLRLRCEYSVETKDLVEVFERLSKSLNKTEKHFTELVIENTRITELKENTFQDITFDLIYIKNNYLLTKIDSNAFGLNFNVSKKVSIWNARLSGMESTLYTTLAKFTNLEELYLFFNELTEISPRNFIPGRFPKLRILGYYGKTFTKIEDYSFSKLKSLEKLIIGYTSIVNISEYVFAFNETKLTLTLELGTGNEKLYLGSFGPKGEALAHFNRPTNLKVEFTYLSENVFSQFMTTNGVNTIDVVFHPFDCSSCYNFWLKKIPGINSRIKNVECTNKLKFEDPKNFPNC